MIFIKNSAMQIFFCKHVINLSK